MAVSPVIVAAESGQLSTMRKLLDGGVGTVEDQDEVKCVCVRACVRACMRACVVIASMCYTPIPG